MKAGWGLAAVAAGLLGAAGAQAGPLEVSAAPACDFFQAELIGEFCARTAYVGAFGDYGHRTLTQTFASPPFAAGTQPSARNTYQSSDEGATLALSPWQGVRITLQDSATQANNSYGFLESFPKQDVSFYNPAWKRSASGSGYLNVGGAVTVWDKQDASSRYLLSIVGNLATMPSNTFSAARDRQEIGWQSGTRWNLGASGLSVDYLGESLLVHYDNPNDVEFVSTSRLLLASAAAGIAAGPELFTQTDLGHNPNLKIGWSAVALGGRVIAEPFRWSGIPVLSDLTVQGYGRGYLGQASLVVPYAGKASAYEFGGSARLNFRY